MKNKTESLWVYGSGFVGKCLLSDQFIQEKSSRR